MSKVQSEIIELMSDNSELKWIPASSIPMRCRSGTPDGNEYLEIDLGRETSSATPIRAAVLDPTFTTGQRIIGNNKKSLDIHKFCGFRRIHFECQKGLF